MIRLIKLYLDNIARFSIKQIYYLILNRWIKKVFPFAIFKIGYRNLNSMDEKNYEIIKINMNNILTYSDSGKPLWEIDSDQIVGNNKYMIGLNNLLGEYIDTRDESILEKFWLTKYDDPEILNNYQRFYLFSEVLINKENFALVVPHLINKWIDFNPHGQNIAWESINCAVRLLNWIKLLYYIPVDKFPSLKEWQKIINSIYLQTQNVFRNIHYHVPGNHIIIQLYVLWLVSSIFPHFDKSSRWLSFSEVKLKEEINRQFYDNGFHCEQSFHYHVQSTIFCLFWYYAMTSIGKSIDNENKDRLFKAVNWIDDFILPDKTVPVIGDCCFPFFHQTIMEDIRNIKEIEKKIIPSSELISIDINNLTDPLQFVIHTVGNSKLIVDVGNIGYEKNPGHGHSDLLSFIYCSDDIPIFVDPGVKSYSNEADSMLLKKAEYHNTISIDGQDQAELWGFFRWSFLPKNLRYSESIGNDEIILEGEYTGFRNIGKVIHKRTFKLNPKRLIVVDRISSNRSHDISVNFILHPNIQANILMDKNVVLSCGFQKWIIRCEGSVPYLVTIQRVNIYREYSEDVHSNRLSFKFNNPDNYFQSRIEIELIEDNLDFHPNQA